MKRICVLLSSAVMTEKCERLDILDDEEDVPFCSLVGRGFARCLLNHLDIPIFLLSFIVMYFSASRCIYCVFIIAIISALLCVRFRILNATLWSAILVLYFQKDWDITLGSVKIMWNKPTA